MEQVSISNFLDTDTAQDFISQCITKLMAVQPGIAQCGNRPPTRGVITLDKEHKEVLSEVMFSLGAVFSQDDDQTTSASPHGFTTIKAAFRTISNCIQQLSLMQCLMYQIDESPPYSSQSLDEKRQNVLCINSTVVSQLKMLFNTADEVAEGDLDYDDDDDDEGVVQGAESAGQQEMEALERLRLDIKKETEGKYLCLSNGYEIWCLDLKLSSTKKGPGRLPIITTQGLLGDDRETSVGLFHLGPDAYVIGGKSLPTSLQDGGMRNGPLGVPGQERNLLYRELCFTWGNKGSSCSSDRLLLDGGALTSSMGYIEPLNSPKFWPIVEKIGRKLHVIDGFPFYLMCHPNSKDFVYSHEVCEVDDENRGGSWQEIPTGEATEHIFNHVVVGDRIYAYSHQGHRGGYFLEFDSRAGQWGRLPRRLPSWVPLYAIEVKTVCEILCLGTGRCAGGFSVSTPHGEEELFVLFAIVYGDYDPEDVTLRTCAVAYLVTLTGQVLCYQHVRGFYSNDKLLRPHDMMAATVIHVGEGTLCSVVSAARWKDYREMEYLFINTFSVELLDCDSVRARIQDLLEKKASEAEAEAEAEVEVGPGGALAEAEAGPGVELEFIRVAVVDRFIYETDIHTGQGGQGRCLGWRACFLTRP